MRKAVFFAVGNDGRKHTAFSFQQTAGGRERYAFRSYCIKVGL